MKIFNDIKKCIDYLESKAKEGETVRLDERATVTNPKKISY